MPLERMVKLVGDYGALIVAFAVLLSAVITGTRLLYLFFKQKIESSKPLPTVTCSRALSGNCPGQNIPDHELRALLLYRIGLKSAANLKAHTLFGAIRTYRSTTIPSLTINDPGRRLVVMDMLRLKMTSIATFVDRWLENNAQAIEDSRMTGSLLLGEWMILISSIVEDYEATYRQLGIPEEAITAFRKYHEFAVDQLIKDIDATAHSDWIVSSTEKVGLILSFVESLLDRLLLDAEASLAELNGSLTGKSYKGVVCGPIPVKGSGKHEVSLTLDGSGAHKVLQAIQESKVKDEPTS